jgi:D-glycero-alpha-D-manno-heptose-7-phosphate kinase
MTVLITRTPLRISLGGGGTDLPSHYRQHGAVVLSAAINKYVFISINQTFVNDYFVKYSALERRTTIDEIEHPIVREALRLVGIGPGVEIVSTADIPSGTGLGSSGTFTVGLLRALYAFRREHVSASELAERACRIEIDLLGQPVGKQDQYIAAYGGLTCFEFHPDDTVTAKPLGVDDSTLHDLESHLLLFFTGYSRAANEILSDQRSRSEAGDREMAKSLKFTQSLGLEIKAALESGDTAGFGGLMHEHWEYKRARSSGMSNPQIDRWYEVGRANGAVGGKLVGAGAGGFLMFYAHDPARLRKAMDLEGLAEVRFKFDLDGSTVLVRG